MTILQTIPAAGTSPVTVPTMTLAEMSALYHRMADQHAISATQRAETSGLRVAQLAQTLLSDSVGDDIEDRPLSILVGLEHLGAVGLVAARHLDEWGAWVQVVTTHQLEAYQENSPQGEANRDAGSSSTTSPETIVAMTALLAQGVASAWAEDGWELPPADLIIDAMAWALDGTENSDMPENCDATYDLIQLVNSHHATVLSIGLPAGLDPDFGRQSGPTLSAASTLALGFPVSTLALDNMDAICGALYLADIDIPAELYTTAGIEKSAIFGPSEIIRLEQCAH